MKKTLWASFSALIFIAGGGSIRSCPDQQEGDKHKIIQVINDKDICISEKDYYLEGLESGESYYIAYQDTDTAFTIFLGEYKDQTIPLECNGTNGKYYIQIKTN